MERVILALLACGVLVACDPQGKAQYDSWDKEFSNRPAQFEQAVTALWISRYQEDPLTKRFERSTAWGQVPEKLVPDGQGGYSVAVPLLLQGENSDGPVPDRFWTVLVRVVRTGNMFTLAPNDALPGDVAGWHDEAARTVWFRGLQTGSQRTLWQFRGRY